MWALQSHTHQLYAGLSFSLYRRVPTILCRLSESPPKPPPHLSSTFFSCSFHLRKENETAKALSWETQVIAFPNSEECMTSRWQRLTERLRFKGHGPSATLIWCLRWVERAKRWVIQSGMQQETSVLTGPSSEASECEMSSLATK